MKFNYPLLSRSLIALLFVVAGIQKIMQFEGTSMFVGTLGLPMPAVLTALVILVEVPIALAYAWGYRVCITGGILVAYVVVVTLLVHRDLSQAGNLVMALKNIAIIGGILATTGACSCGRCYSLNPKK
jgi:putative oxidoreductase